MIRIIRIITIFKRLREAREWDEYVNGQSLRLPDPNDSIEVQIKLQRMWARARRS